MNAQPANPGKKNATFVARFVLWLIAVLSLADLAPATAEQRFARPGEIRAEAIEPAIAQYNVSAVCAQAAVDDLEPLPAIEPQGDDPAIDGDDVATAMALAPRGKAADPGGIVAAQCPDGQPLTAFRSRAPPVPA
jgi:hypothetical protein